MPSNIKFHVLNVGQGSGNFIEIFAKDGDVVPATTVLIDLGAEGASTSHHGPSVERIVASLNSMTDAEIACLCLSHSDTDHISMIEQLLSEFSSPHDTNPTKKVLTIKTAYYGGNYGLYSKRKRENVLKLVWRYMPGDDEPLSVTTNTSTYVGKGVPLYEDSTLGFKLPLLIGNTVKAEDAEIDDSFKLPKSGAVNLNTVSLVVVFDWNTLQFITTGDATGITMLRANTVMGDGVGSFFGTPVMVTVPHHGSISTAFDFTGQGISSSDKRDQILLFARRTGAKLLTASAGNENKFKHPSAYILDLFWRYSSTTLIAYRDTAAATDGHFYTAYFEDDDGFKLTTDDGDEQWPADGKDNWYCAQSPVQIYTTDYFPRGRQRAFTPKPKGDASPKKKAKVEDPKMALFPASVATPSPGSLTDIPDNDDYPPAEVGWTIVGAADKTITMTRIDPDTSSLARLHAIVRRAELHYGLQSSRSSAPAGATPPPPAATPAPTRPRPRPRPGDPAGPRPKRR